MYKWHKFIVISVILALTSFWHAHALPSLGNDMRAVLSLKDERTIGTMWLQQARANNLLNDDLIVNEYIRYLGKKLTAVTSFYDIKPLFFVGRDQTVNAFAMLGSNIVINNGLILLTNSESELAAVMAHELAHVSQQHILRSIAQSKKSLPIAMIGAIAAIMAGAPDLIMPILEGHALHAIHFTRQHEQEADRIGIQILANAGFDPHGMPNIFQLMKDHDRYEIKIPQYILTHPIYNSRISDSRNRANYFKYQQVKDNFLYQLTKVRIKVQTTHEISKTIEILKYKQNTDVMQYGKALALMLSEKYEKAVNIIQDLMLRYPENLIINMTAAEIMSAQQNYPKAKIILDKILPLYPDSYGLLLQYAELLLSMKKAKQVKSILKTHMQLYPNEPKAYSLLIRAEALLNNQVNMHEATAELNILNGNFTNALIHLDIALEHLSGTNNNYINNRIQAKKESIKQRMKEQDKFK